MGAHIAGKQVRLDVGGEGTAEIGPCGPRVVVYLPDPTVEEFACESFSRSTEGFEGVDDPVAKEGCNHLLEQEGFAGSYGTTDGQSLLGADVAFGRQLVRVCFCEAMHEGGVRDFEVAQKGQPLDVTGLWCHKQSAEQFGDDRLSGLVGY